MPLTREEQSLDLMREAYRDVGEVEYVSALYQIRKEQKNMIEQLAKVNGVTQVAIVRDIIDEWRKMKLGDCNGQ